MGNSYAISALIDKRAEIAGLILDLERQVGIHRAALLHLDATLKLLDPTIKPTRHPSQASHGRPLGLLRLGRAIGALSRRRARGWREGSEPGRDRREGDGGYARLCSSRH